MLNFSQISVIWGQICFSGQHFIITHNQHHSSTPTILIHFNKQPWITVVTTITLSVLAMSMLVTAALTSSPFQIVSSSSTDDLKSTNNIQFRSLTLGYTTGSGNILEWAQGNFYACHHQLLYTTEPDLHDLCQSTWCHSFERLR